MGFVNYNAIPLQAGATVTTVAIPAALMVQCSAQIVATSGASGTLKIQASNDMPLSPQTPPTNWSDIPSASVSVTGAGVFLIPKTDTCYNFIRLVFTNTGAGTVSAIVQGIVL